MLYRDSSVLARVLSRKKPTKQQSLTNEIELVSKGFCCRAERLNLTWLKDKVKPYYSTFQAVLNIIP